MIRVLILDAVLASVELLSTALQAHPESVFIIVTATSAAEAQKRVEQAREVFDIFLICQRLESDTDGITALKRLRLLSPGTASVVLFTTYNTEGAQQAYQAGAHLYLPKDIDHVALIWLLRSVYSQRPLQPGGRDWIGVLINVADKIQQMPWQASMDKVAKAIVQGGLQLGFERARLWLFKEDRDKKKNMFIGWAHAGNTGLKRFVDSEMPFDKSYYGRYMREQREPYRFFGREQGPSFLDSKFGTKGFKAPIGYWVIVPLWSRNTLLGVLSLDDVHLPRVIDDKQFELLRLYGRLVVAAWEQAKKSYENDRLKKLTEMAQEAQQKGSVKEVGDVVVGRAVQLGFKRARLYLYQYDPQKERLIGLSEKGNRGLEDFVDFAMPIEKSEYCKGIASQQDPAYFEGSDRDKTPGYLDRHFPDFKQPKSEWVIIPLRAEDKFLGMLVLDNAEDRRRFTTEQKTLLSLLSRQVVAILEWTRTSYMLDKLTEMAEAAQRAHSVNEVAKVIVQGGLSLGFKRARLWQVVQESGKFSLVALYQDGNANLEDFRQKSVPFEESPHLQTILDLKKHKPIYYPAGRDSNPLYFDKDTEKFRPPTGEWVEVPLWSSEQLIGTLTLDNANEKKIIPPYNDELLDLIGQQAAAALACAQAEESIRLQTALKIADAVSETLDVDQTICNVLTELKELFRDSNLFILLYNKERNVLEFTSASIPDFYKIDPHHDGIDHVPLDNTSMVGQLASESITSPEKKIKKLGNVKELNTEISYRELISSTQSEICITLMVDNHLIGVLAIEHNDKYAFKRTDEELLLIVRPMISIALDRALKSTRLPIKWKPDNTTREQVIKLLASDGAIVSSDEVDSLLRWLFWDVAEEIEVEGNELLIPDFPSVPQRNSVGLQIWADGSRYLVKIGNRQRIRTEVDKFQTYISGRIKPQLYATYRRSKELENIGGAWYSFIEERDEPLISFPRFYHQTVEHESIITSLDHLFESWGDYYKKKQKDDTSLFWAYTEVWQPRWREQLPARWHQRLLDFVRDPTAPQPPLSQLPHPIPWLIERFRLDQLHLPAVSHSKLPNTYKAVTHGDLNGDNMFVDMASGKIYVSGYKRTGGGPALQDFLELEVNILVRIMPLIDGEQQEREVFYNLTMNILSIPYDANSSKSPIYPIKHTEASKAWKVICGLRRCMYRHTSVKDVRQIRWGLLFNATNLATLLHERGGERRRCERALLLASLICMLLDNLEILPPSPPDPHQPFDVFLSYKSVDESWVIRLKNALQAYGLRVWLDRDEIRPGDLYVGALERGLEESKSVVLIVSPEAMASKWVEEEYSRAVALTRKKNPPLQLIPVILREAQLPGFLDDRTSVDFRDGTILKQVWND